MGNGRISKKLQTADLHLQLGKWESCLNANKSHLFLFSYAIELMLFLHEDLRFVLHFCEEREGKYFIQEEGSVGHKVTAASPRSSYFIAV